MNRSRCTTRPAVISLVITLALLYAPAFPANDDINTVCAARCSGFTGQSYSQCITTCVRTSKKNKPADEKTVSQRMKECEEICAVYEGVDNIKCLRLCLDKNK